MIVNYRQGDVSKIFCYIVSILMKFKRYKCVEPLRLMRHMTPEGTITCKRVEGHIHNINAGSES